MDLSFFRRAEQRFASRTPARFDFGMLVAALRSQREAGPAALARTTAAPVPRFADPIAEILLAGPAWREAVAAQGGCFNREVARHERLPKKCEAVVRPGSAHASESSAFPVRRGDASPGKAQGAVN
jgi:hypothetical protein